MKYYISFEAGGTSIRFAILDEALNVIQFEKISTRDFNASADTFAVLCDSLDGMIASVGKENVLAICSSWASMLDLDCRVLLSTPNIRGFDNFPIADRLEERFSLPAIIVRDCNSLLLYEIWKQKLDPQGIIMGAFLGTGLGNAMCINNELYNGANGACCELGHIPVRGVDGTCVCGKQGCIEVICSGKQLHRMAEEKYKVPIFEIFLKHLNEEDVYNVVRFSAIAIATEITILDPKYMVIGGGVLSIPGFPFERFEAEIRNNLRFPNPRYSSKFVYATGDAHAGVIGAALNARNVLFSKS